MSKDTTYVHITREDVELIKLMAEGNLSRRKREALADRMRALRDACRTCLNNLDNADTVSRWERYRKAAQKHTWEGELEVDDNALVWEGDDTGAYVMAWLWVSGEEAGIKSFEEDEKNEEQGIE